jgi:hypothetical protein
LIYSRSRALAFARLGSASFAQEPLLGDFSHSIRFSIDCEALNLSKPSSLPAIFVMEAVRVIQHQLRQRWDSFQYTPVGKAEYGADVKKRPAWGSLLRISLCVVGIISIIIGARSVRCYEDLS